LTVTLTSACGTQHDGTAKWFIRGSTFYEWRTNDSLLWVRDNHMLLLPCHTFMIANGFIWFFSGVWQEYPLVRSHTSLPVIGNLYCCQVRTLLRKSSIFEHRDQLWSHTTTSTSRMLPNKMSAACLLPSSCNLLTTLTLSGTFFFNYTRHVVVGQNSLVRLLSRSVVTACLISQVKSRFTSLLMPWTNVQITPAVPHRLQTV